MSVHKFNEVQCQILKVTGPNKIEGADSKDVTALLTASVEKPLSFEITKAAGAANIVEVTIKPLDSNGAVLTGHRTVELWASDDSAGAGLASTWAIDTVTAKSTFGSIFTALTAVKHYIAQTNASGVLTLVLTDAATGGGYLAVKNPVTGLPQLIQIEAGDYGV